MAPDLKHRSCSCRYGGGRLDFLLLCGLAIAWGIGDATFNTQISALLGIFYPDDTVRQTYLLDISYNLFIVS